MLMVCTMILSAIMSILEHLADDDAVLVIGDRLSQAGQGVVQVARQYTGSAGKITNCQIGVFAAYVSRHGHAFVDRALYLPKEWTDDPDRLEAAYVPPMSALRPNHSFATRMVAHAIAVSVPFKWVAGDTVYGVVSTPEQKCIGLPEQKYLSDGGKKAPELGGHFSSNVRLRWDYPTACPGWSGASGVALIEPVAVAVHLQDMDVMGEPVEQCTGEPLGTEHAGPFIERQVRGDDG